MIMLQVFKGCLHRRVEFQVSSVIDTFIFLCNGSIALGKVNGERMTFMVDKLSPLVDMELAHLLWVLKPFGPSDLILELVWRDPLKLYIGRFDSAVKQGTGFHFHHSLLVGEIGSLPLSNSSGGGKTVFFNIPGLSDCPTRG
jgi:hypothetical protein